jgi:hypothetical protein
MFWTSFGVEHWLISVRDDSAGKRWSGGEEMVSEMGSESHQHEPLLTKEKEVKAGNDE